MEQPGPHRLDLICDADRVGRQVVHDARVAGPERRCEPIGSGAMGALAGEAPAPMTGARQTDLDASGGSASRRTGPEGLDHPLMQRDGPG